MKNLESKLFLLIAFFIGTWGHVYDDAGRSKTKLGNNDFRLQRRIRETRHAGGIHPADQ